MRIVDTHAHLDATQFDQDLHPVLQRAADAGVYKIICVGTTVESSRACLELAERFPERVHAAVGIHPNYSSEEKEADFDLLGRWIQHPGAVALGETGLDYHHDYSPKDRQKDFFRRHIRLALATNTPLIIHSRKADSDTLEILRQEGERIPGVRHCFDSSAQIAAAYLELGLHVAFGGTLTRRGHKKLKTAARSVPDERLLVETDCPYMIPRPVDVRRNEPAFITHTVEALSDLRNRTPEKIAESTTRNAEELFFARR